MSEVYIVTGDSSNLVTSDYWHLREDTLWNMWNKPTVVNITCRKGRDFQPLVSYRGKKRIKLPWYKAKKVVSVKSTQHQTWSPKRETVTTFCNTNRTKFDSYTHKASCCYRIPHKMCSSAKQAVSKASSLLIPSTVISSTNVGIVTCFKLFRISLKFQWTVM